MSNWETLGIDAANRKISRQLIKLLEAAVELWLEPAGLISEQAHGPLQSYANIWDPTNGTGARPWGCHMSPAHLQSHRHLVGRCFLGVYP